MKLVVSRLCIILVLVGCSLGTYAKASEDTETAFNTLLDEIWQYELSVQPVSATGYGVHLFDDRLADTSPAGLAAEDAQYRSFLARLATINSAELSRNEQITLQVQRYRLQDYIDQYAFNAHFMPLTSESGFHSSLAFLPAMTRFKGVEDYQNYLARLAQFPRIFAEQIYWMRQGIATGIVQPKAVLTGFEDSVKAFIFEKPQQSEFYQPFLQLDSVAINAVEKNRLRSQAEQIIQDSVFVAYQDFYDFLLQEYLPASKDNIAATSWPKGLEYYQNRSNHYTTTTLPVEDIHQLGLSEVKRIRAEMQIVLDGLDFEGDINQFINFLRSDPRFYAKTPEELLKQASYIAKKMDARLPQLFNILPRIPYGVAPVPESIAPKYTTGRYVAPTRDDQPGYYWVNTYALDKRPLYALTALTLHEAVPGHHLQISLAAEMQNLPNVRRYSYMSAFGEGWGLYAEYLGKEVGMYTNPYDEFGRLSYEMWRACRLVVDTGMHVKGWSREQAIEFMLENTALSEHNVKTEIDRYISWPAQALSYKIGELSIKKLRLKAQEKLGERFDLRAFHDAVLAYGSVPLSVLETNIEHYIANQP
ncbi:DUF885 domain-containing protein [Flavobacterium sp. W21_SRS_FM6]|uniref:DUF885 domain-containing protein n=1 Tax=Flavobacterium sp. W21_SRS_FM6 TaxID=3240268 RepID=UPI003F92D414